MTTLTPNRLLQKGDEYRDNGTWKPVPKDDYGLQVMFTKYAEVRRPNETPKTFPARKASAASTTPPSGTGQSDKIATPANPVSTAKCAPSGGETILPPPAERGIRAVKSEKEIEANGLPTVVSPKAHQRFPHLEITPAQVKRAKEAFIELKRREKSEEAAVAATFAEIKFPAGSPKTIWTGRNGTFNSLGVELQREAGTNICSIVPQGKRGTAKNAVIEFPVSAIPQMIDFLQRQLT